MKEQCYDEGTIQAFLDGELNSDMLENVARHVAFCDGCSLLLQDAEEESAFAFAALDEEFNTLVPTERIRTNLYQAISEIEKPKVSFWERITNFSWVYSNPSITAFASLLVVAGLFAVVWEYNSRMGVSPVEIAQNPPTVQNPPIQQNQTVTSASPVQGTGDESKLTFVTAKEKPSVNSSVETKANDFKPKYQNLKYTTAPASVRRSVEERPSAAPAELLSGEVAYVKTIATLNKTVDENKDLVLSPSARVAFEKDLAIVNDAISKMKTEVRKNPKNDGAKTILRNSYQSKIDLLSSVAERSQTVAGLD